MPLIFDKSSLIYNENDDIYYALGINYCDRCDDEYHRLSVYVPASLVRDGNVCDAPIAMFVDTPGFSAHKAQNEYNIGMMKTLTDNGMVCVDVGCRGIVHGAPYGVTDLKAAVRYIKYNRGQFPGDSEKIFPFGHSGGGAQSVLLGASGANELYAQYLDEIGAVMKYSDGSLISDTVCGVMAYCPVTSFDTADCAYEWMMGRYDDDGSRADGTWTKELSCDLCSEYAEYINEIGLNGEGGEKLTIDDDGINGSYNDYILYVLTLSLNRFLASVSFPYTYEGKTYNSKEEYIDSLNCEGGMNWVRLNPKSGRVSVNSIEGFVKARKKPYKHVGAFDGIRYDSLENGLYRDCEKEYRHFDSIELSVLKKNKDKYLKLGCDDIDEIIKNFESDISSMAQETGGNKVSLNQRCDMYNPMFYLLGGSLCNAAPHWRIRSGATQADTALTTEINLALALAKRQQVRDVNLDIIWDKGHEMAEWNESDPMEEFAKWVKAVI